MSRTAQDAASAAPTAAVEFDWTDPLLFDDMLSEDERLVRDSARAYCQEKLMPRVLEANRHERFDREILREMGALGFLGSTIDGYGCAGVNNVSYGLVAREVERVDSGYRSAMSVQSSLVMHPIHAYGTDEQRERFLPRLASGEIVGCFGLTEPNHGSDPGSMISRASKAAGGFVLRGSKTWITNSPIADVFIVWRKTRASSAVISRKGHGQFYAPPIKEVRLRASSTGRSSWTACSCRTRTCEAEGLAGPFGCLNKALRHRVGRAWRPRICWHAARQYSLIACSSGGRSPSTAVISMRGVQPGLKWTGPLTPDGRRSRGTEIVSMLKRNCAAARARRARHTRRQHLRRISHHPPRHES